MTNRYEVLVLSVPEITGEETAALEKELERVLKGADAKLMSFERWGKFKLSYPVKKNDYGVYFLARFEVDGDLSNAIGAVNNLYSVKFNDVVMRNIITQLNPKAPLTYIRPDSLEEAPSREGSFLKEGRGPRNSSMSSLHDNENGESLTDFNAN